jgi:tetratricopeptide (TPR) repeat protein
MADVSHGPGAGEPVDAVLAASIAAAGAALQRGEAALARAVAREAVARARAGAAPPLLLAEACVHEAIASNILFDYEAAYERALEADALLAGGPSALRSRSLNACFVACAETGDLTRALEYSRRAMELARADGDAAAMARVLHNRGNLFRHLGEFDEAQRCLQEAVHLFESQPRQPARAVFARINLAVACLDHAMQLSMDHQAARAAELRRRTAEALPALPEDRAAEPQLSELSALGGWVVIQSELGRLAEARQGVCRYLGLMRRAGGASRYRAYALAALAAYHFHSGRRERGVQRQQAAVARLQAAGGRLELLEAQQRLGRMLAACGRYGPALDCVRAAQANRERLHSEQARLRCRLAALEREAERSSAVQLETPAHAQRLAVVGRLMSDIHHALAIPIALTHTTLSQCIERASPQALNVALRRVIEQVDKAAGLARQLKMFSYRAAPQAMVVDLNEGLLEAWDGVALWRRDSARSLSVVGDLATQVRVDVQRLAVLLRILLIEADRAAPVALTARIASIHGSGRMELCWPRAQGPRALQSGGSVGLTLCREIVQEMGGRLAQLPPAGAEAGFVLELPVP